MRILIAGDYSNYSVTLRDALRAAGHEVTLASDGCSWLDTERDIDLRRPLPGKLGGGALWGRLHLPSMRRRLSGHDVVLVNSPQPLSLHYSRNAAFLRFLRQANRSLFVMATGDDPVMVEEFADAGSELAYSEYRTAGGSLTSYALQGHRLERWQAAPLRAQALEAYGMADGALSALYEYDVALRRVLAPARHAYAGIPIDVERVPQVITPETSIREVVIFLGRHRDRQMAKGTDMLEVAARRVVERHPGKASLRIVENRPYAEYLELLNGSHIVLDQVNSYSPATNALLAMARGQTAVSGGEGLYYDFIGEGCCRPIANALPDVDYLTGLIEGLVLDARGVARRSVECREFVRRHNDSVTVARRVVEFVESRLAERARL